MKNLLIVFFVSSWAMGWTHVSNNIRGWKQKPVTFYVNSAGCPLSDSDLNEIIDTAISTWNGISESGLIIKKAETTTTVSEFLAGNATQLPVILCDTQFSSQVGASGVGVIPAATFKTDTDDEGNLNYSGILLNAQSGAGANIGNLNQGQVEITLAHEMGHALGLGHSSQSEALMYYSLGSKQEPILTEDDTDGIAHIYPRNEFSGGVMGCSSVKSHPANPRLGMGLPAIAMFVIQLIVTWFWARKFRPEQPL